MSSPLATNLPRHIVLLGLMGVGKTTVGRTVAERLGRALDDSDLSIEERCGATVRELGERLGVEAMHRLESQHLIDALERPAPSVVCAAASIVEDERCLRALRAHDVFTVWLEGDLDTLVRRFATGPHRPVLDADTAALLRRQLAARTRAFTEVARLRVRVDGRSAATIAGEIIAAARRAQDAGA